MTKLAVLSDIQRTVVFSKKGLLDIIWDAAKPLYINQRSFALFCSMNKDSKQCLVLREQDGRAPLCLCSLFLSAHQNAVHNSYNEQFLSLWQQKLETCHVIVENRHIRERAILIPLLSCIFGIVWCLKLTRISRPENSFMQSLKKNWYFFLPHKLAVLPLDIV